MKQTLVILCMMALLGCKQTPVETNWIGTSLVGIRIDD